MEPRIDIEFDELTLNAFVDGQLDSAQHREVLQAMESDAVVREQVCRLRRAKDWMQTGFADARPDTSREPQSCRSWLPSGSGIAAAFLMAFIALAGGMTGYLLGESDSSALVGVNDPNRVVLHLSESDPARFQAVLDYAETFLLNNQERAVQVEVVANAGGVDLMRANASAYETRVRQLSDRYTNLHFIACANALRNLRSSGADVQMLDRVAVERTAIDHIVSRLNEGWTYRRVAELSGV